jgi:hypothetical protein
VMPRSPETMAAMRVTGTWIAFARRYWGDAHGLQKLLGKDLAGVEIRYFARHGDSFLEADSGPQ